MKKLIPIVVITLVLFSLAGEIQAQNEPNNINSTQSKNENELNDKVKATKETEKITNIKDNLKFTNEKPAILSIINSEKLNVKAVGLKKGQIMSKHKAGLKSLLIVLKGKIEFVIGEEKFVLNELDTYEIPVNVEHEIRAVKQSIFSLTQEK